MTKSILVEQVRETCGVTIPVATEAVEQIIAAIRTALSAGENATFRLVGLGTFKTAKRPATNGKNPATGEALAIPAQVRISFKAAADFKAAVQEAVMPAPKPKPGKAKSKPKPAVANEAASMR